jgi:hypothetical protein
VTDQAPAPATLNHKVDDDRVGVILKAVGPPPAISSGTGRDPKVNRTCQKWLLRFLAELPSPTHAARLLGCSTAAIYRARDRDPAFAAEFHAAMDKGRESVTALFWERAAGVGYRYVATEDGRVLMIPNEASDRLLEAAFKFQHAEVFQKHVVEHQLAPGSMTLTFTPRQLDALTRKERLELTRLVAKMDAAAPKTLEHAA